MFKKKKKSLWNSERPTWYLPHSSTYPPHVTHKHLFHTNLRLSIPTKRGGKKPKSCLCANYNSRSTYFPLVQSSTVKTETISFGSVSPGGVKLEISTKEVPVVHTETKTITYESSQVRQSVKARALALCFAPLVAYCI